MDKDKTGGQAFPLENATKAQQYGHAGMTLRDYFAAKAMQGALAKGIGTLSKSDLARWAYTYADAMIKERSNGP